MVAACGAILAQEPELVRVRQTSSSPMPRGERGKDRYDYPGLSTLPRSLSRRGLRETSPCTSCEGGIRPRDGDQARLQSNQRGVGSRGVGCSLRDSLAAGRPLRSWRRRFGEETRERIPLPSSMVGVQAWGGVALQSRSPL